MNPLSAIRPLASPELMPALNKLDAGPAAIPFRELQELSASGYVQPGTPLNALNEVQHSSFEGLLGRMVSEVNAKQAAAGEAVNGLMSGQGVPLHQAVIAMEEAGVSFQLMVEVRNKMLEAYQELMRMQV